MFLLGQTLGAVAFGAVTHALGYPSMWSVLTLLLLIGSALSLGLARAPAR
jgi:predicted MFS family arabinose efflux permease